MLQLAFFLLVLSGKEMVGTKDTWHRKVDTARSSFKEMAQLPVSTMRGS